MMPRLLISWSFERIKNGHNRLECPECFFFLSLKEVVKTEAYLLYFVLHMLMLPVRVLT